MRVQYWHALCDVGVNKVDAKLACVLSACCPQVTASQKRLQNKYELAQQTADDWYR